MKEIAEVKVIRLEDCALARQAEGLIAPPLAIRRGEEVFLSGFLNRLPDSNGQWDGKRGYSQWIPNPEYVPLQSNPDRKSWESILEEYKIDGIPFHNEEPDFREVSKGEVTITPFEDRQKNFSRADKELARQRRCTPEEVREWRHEHGYTWHECSDMKTMQKVPSVIHNNVPHSGGQSRRHS